MPINHQLCWGIGIWQPQFRPGSCTTTILIAGQPFFTTKTPYELECDAPNSTFAFFSGFSILSLGRFQASRTPRKKVPGPGEWAESWEIVDHGEDQSVVVDGQWQGWSLRKLIEQYPDEILGDQPSTLQFPLLLKYLDCNRVLSVQVHPDDAYGATLSPPDLGKTEAWYVVEADPEAVVYAGLRPGVTADSLRRAIQEGKTEETLHVIHPKAGDCIFIPAGTVHALGAGLVVAEIQQASDTTFRLYDWNRVDASGKGRPLHIEQAMDVIDFRRGPVVPCVPHVISRDSIAWWIATNSRSIDLANRGAFQYLSTDPFG